MKSLGWKPPRPGGVVVRVGRAVWGRLSRPWVLALLVLALVAGVLGAVGWGMRKGLNFIERRQAERLAGLGLESLERDTVVARMAAETALRLDGGNAKALRLLGVLEAMQGRGGEALAAYDRLLRTGVAGVGDLEIHARLALHMGDRALASRLAGVVDVSGRPGFSHRMRAEAAEREGREAEAEDAWRQALAASDGDEERMGLAHCLLARALVADEAAEGLALLGEVARGGGPMAAEAGVAGLLSGFLPVEERMEWVGWLREAGGVTGRLALVADTIEVECGGTVDRVSSRVVERVRGADLSARTEAAHWLMLHGRAAEARGLIGEEEACGDAPAYRLLVQAAFETGDVEFLRHLLGRVDVPFGELERGLYVARVRSLAGGGDVEGGYRQVLASARTPGERSFAAVYLVSAGEDALLTEWVGGWIKGDGECVLPVLTQVMPILARGDKAARMIELVEMAMEAPGFSNHPGLANGLAHARLVAGVEVDPGETLARWREFPNDRALRFTHALALLRAGRSAEALAVLDDPVVPAHRLDTSQKVIAACVRAANGERGQAARLARAVQGMVWTREERAMLEEYVR